MAPLRLGLAGGGTDVSPYSDIFGGCVLNATINHYAYANIERIDGNKIIFEAVDLKKRAEFSLDEPIPLDGDLVLHKGVYNCIIRDYNKNERLSLRIVTHCDAPLGSGLGSSSAMVVALLNAFSELLRLPLGEYDLARLAYEVERTELGMEGGKQDQYAATFGGFNFMEFFKDKVIVNPLRIKAEVLAELQYNLLLYHLGSSRISSEIISSQISHVKLNDEKPVNSMHKLKEQAVMQKEALLTGNLNEFGRLLGYGWHYKKEMSKKISNPEIDSIYERCMELGALGAKVSGAGGGGFLMVYIEGTNKQKISDGLSGFRGNFVNFQFVKDGAIGWSVEK